MSELEQLEKMLSGAHIEYERDEQTYPDRVVIRIIGYNFTIQKRKIAAIFDFTTDGKLISVG